MTILSKAGISVVLASTLFAVAGAAAMTVALRRHFAVACDDEVLDDRKIQKEDPAQRRRWTDLGRRAQQLDHDLRGPLGAMAVALDLMTTTDDAGARAEAAEVISRQLGRLTTLTLETHEFSRMLQYEAILTGTPDKAHGALSACRERARLE